MNGVQERLCFRTALKIIRESDSAEQIRAAAQYLAEKLKDVQARGGVFAKIGLSENVAVLLG